MSGRCEMCVREKGDVVTKHLIWFWSCGVGFMGILFTRR